MLDQLLIELKVLWKLALFLGPVVFWIVVGLGALVLLRKGGDMWGMKEWWR